MVFFHRHDRVVISWVSASYFFTSLKGYSNVTGGVTILRIHIVGDIRQSKKNQRYVGSLTEA